MHDERMSESYQLKGNVTRSSISTANDKLTVLAGRAGQVMKALDPTARRAREASRSIILLCFYWITCQKVIMMELESCLRFLNKDFYDARCVVSVGRRVAFISRGCSSKTHALVQDL